MKHLPRSLATLVGVALVLTASAALWGCGGEDKKQAAVQAAAAPVTTAPAEARVVEYTLEQVGSVDSALRSTLRSRVDSSIVDIAFQEGAEVKKGDVLVRLDDGRIMDAIRNLEAGIKQLEVRLAFQQKTLERNRTLLKRSAIAQHQFDSLESETKETELAIAKAKADLSRQRELLADTVIRAPFAGVVGARKISLGDFLKTGDQVVAVVVLDPLEVAFNVPERYKAKLSIGQKVHVQVAAEGDKLFDGSIFFIAPIVDAATRSFMVKARLENPDHRLNPGMFAKVRLVVDTHPQAVTVPWSAVIITEKETYIYLAENGKARKLPVTLGKVTAQWAEVLASPLKPGEQVILEGKYSVHDGQPVAVNNNQNAPAGPAKQGS